jgi:TolB protein
MRSVTVLLFSAMAAAPLSAQDTVRVGINYQPGVRQGLIVLPAAGLDSVRTIIARDLDYSDRFEVINLAQPPEGTSGGAGGTSINYAFYRTLGAGLAVELVSAAGGVTVKLHDLATEKVRAEANFTVNLAGAGDDRFAIHSVSDEIVRWATGQPGVASTRIAFLSEGRIWRIDSDGANLTAVTRPACRSCRPPGRRTAAASPTCSSIRMGPSRSSFRRWRAGPGRWFRRPGTPRTSRRCFRPMEAASYSPG